MIQITTRERMLLKAFLAFSCNDMQRAQFKCQLPHLWHLITINAAVDDIPPSTMRVIHDMIIADRKLIAINLIRRETGWEHKQAFDCMNDIANNINRV